MQKLESAGRDHDICRGPADHADCSSLPALAIKGFNPDDHLEIRKLRHIFQAATVIPPMLGRPANWTDENLTVRCRSIKFSLESCVITDYKDNVMRRQDSPAAKLTSSRRIPAPSSPSPGSIAAFRFRESL